MNNHYTDVCILHETKHGPVMLVREQEHGFYAVKRALDVEHYPVYRKLMHIRNPYLVPVYEAEQADGQCIVIEEFTDGELLKHVLEREQTFTREQTIRYMCMLCDAVGELHRRGLVHRDINPNNIFVTRDDRLKLFDYDIMREKKIDKNRDTEVLGTHGYAPPEQFGYGQTGMESDIYSLGMVMQVMLTGDIHKAYTGDKHLETIIQQCICMEPEFRYETVDRMAEDLERVADDWAEELGLTFFEPRWRYFDLFGKKVFFWLGFACLVLIQRELFGSYGINQVCMGGTMLLSWIIYFDPGRISRRILGLTEQRRWFRFDIAIFVIVVGVLLSRGI